MSEDRYAYGYEVPLNVPTQSIPVITDTLNGKQYYSLRQVVELLNELQELIEELQASDEMGWKRAERFEKKCPKELHNKKMYIKRLEYKVQKFKEENEQLKKYKKYCAEWMGVKEENLSLRCVNMSEKRFVCIDIGYGDDWYITDDGKRLSEMEIVDLLNEMNEDIQYLNAFLVEQGLAEEYILWKGDD